MGFLSALNDIGNGVKNFFGAPFKAVQSAIEGKSIGQVLGEAFIPGYAVYTGLKEEHSSADWIEQSQKSDVEIVTETWENAGQLDLNNDGVTLSDHVDKVADFVEDLYGVDIPYVGNEESGKIAGSSGSSGSFNFLGLVIPASIIGFLFLL